MEIDEQDVAEAMSELFSRRMIQEVTPAVLANISRLLASPPNVIAPADLLLPELGEITFTMKGARLLVALREDVLKAYPSSLYLNDLAPDGSGHIYANSLDLIARAVLDLGAEIRSLARVGNTYGIGPWRSDWWYLNRSGWAVEIFGEDVRDMD